jgi:hypothetical protein
MHEEEGWSGKKYGHREPRKAFCYRHAQSAPAAFLTLVVAYRGTEAPQIAAELAAEFEVGADRVEVQVEASGESWTVGRDLDGLTAWSRRSGSAAQER